RYSSDPVGRILIWKPWSVVAFESAAMTLSGPFGSLSLASTPSAMPTKSGTSSAVVDRSGLIAKKILPAGPTGFGPIHDPWVPGVWYFGALGAARGLAFADLIRSTPTRMVQQP